MEGESTGDDSARYLCPKCGYRVYQRKMRKTLIGGPNVAVVNTVADICERCHQWLFSDEQRKAFKRIERRLASGDTDDFKLIGKSYKTEMFEWPPSNIDAIFEGLEFDERTGRWV